VIKYFTTIYNNNKVTRVFIML